MGTPFTRDTDTLGEDGPELTAAETDSARDMEAPGLVNQPANPADAPSSTSTSHGPGGPHGMAEARRQRPQFSPVAQPGMVEEIHWHTVKSEQRAPGPPVDQRRGRGRRGRKGKGRGRG